MFFSTFPKTVLKKCSLEMIYNCIDCIHIGIKEDSFITVSNTQLNELVQNNLLHQKEIPNVTCVNDKSRLSKESLFCFFWAKTDYCEHAKGEITYLCQWLSRKAVDTSNKYHIGHHRFGIVQHKVNS